MIGTSISHMCFALCLTRPPSRFLWCKHKGSSARKPDVFLRLSIVGLDVIGIQVDIVLAICSWNSFLHLSHKLLDITRTACNVWPNSNLPMQNFRSRASTAYFTSQVLWEYFIQTNVILSKSFRERFNYKLITATSAKMAFLLSLASEVAPLKPNFSI